MSRVREVQDSRLGPSAYVESIPAHAVQLARFTSKGQKFPTKKINISPKENKFETFFLFTVQSG